MMVAIIVFHHQQDVARSRIDTLAKAQGIATALNSRMTGVMSTLKTLASAELVTNDDFSGFHRRTKQATVNQQLAAITLVNAQGQPLLDSAVPYGMALPPMAPPQITELVHTGKSGFVNLFQDHAAGTQRVAVVVPMKLANGANAALIATLTPDNLRQLLVAAALPEGWPTALVDNQGVVMARSISHEKFVGQKVRAELWRRMQQVPYDAVDSVTLEGIPVVTAFSHSALTNWSVAIGVPRSELTSRLQTSLLQLLGGTALLVAGSLALAHVVASRITDTIKTLMAQAKSLGRGEKITATRLTFLEAEQLSAALSQAAKQLGHTKAALVQRNLDLQQFTFVASHDLRTPLKTINGYLSLLKRRSGATLDPEAIDLLDRTHRALTEMDQLTLDLLAYARADASIETMTQVNCDALVADTIAFLKPAIQQTQAQVRIAALPTVLGDRNQLIQLFQNLLSNALNYCEAGPPEVQIKAVRGVGEWVFSVADNGIGIEPIHHKKIFEVFKRLHTSKEYRGNGIGLAVCQRVVERHGGQLWLESALGQGSTFYFSIPDGLSAAP